ncbi:MAG: hypothetical protein R3E66_24920, partial [bacterium]
MPRHALISIHVLFFALVGVSCADDGNSSAVDVGVDVTVATDVGGMDVATGVDAGLDGGMDASLDGGFDAQTDEGVADMSVATGFGVITGQCGEIDMTELLSSQPFLFVNTIDFQMDPYDDADLPRLTPGGQEIIADGNAGGSSIMSEVFAYEVLERCDMAALLKTETEIV